MPLNQTLQTNFALKGSMEAAQGEVPPEWLRYDGVRTRLMPTRDGGVEGRAGSTARTTAA